MFERPVLVRALRIGVSSLFSNAMSTPRVPCFVHEAWMFQLPMLVMVTNEIPSARRSALLHAPAQWGICCAPSQREIDDAQVRRVLPTCRRTGRWHGRRWQSGQFRTGSWHGRCWQSGQPRPASWLGGCWQSGQLRPAFCASVILAAGMRIAQDGIRGTHSCEPLRHVIRFVRRVPV